MLVSMKLRATLTLQAVGVELIATKSLQKNPLTSQFSTAMS
jgi:hypothetical protein